MTIGEVDGPPGQTLHGVVDVDLVPDGILVAQATEVRLYDEGGTLVSSYGRPGRGPGEFSRISSVVSCGEDLFATDLLRPTPIGFRWSGDAWTVPSPPVRSESLNGLTLLYCNDGDLYGTLLQSPPGADDRTVARTKLHAVRLHAAEGRMDTLVSFSGREVFDGLHVPFGAEGAIAFGDTLLHVVDTAQPEVRTYTLDGELVAIVRLELSPSSVTATDVRRMRERYLDPAPPGARSEIQERLDRVPIPTQKPFFSDVLAGHDGTIWLRRYRPFANGSRWEVIGADGRWLDQVSLPDGFDPHVVTASKVMGVTVDSLGVERIRAYPLHR